MGATNTASLIHCIHARIPLSLTLLHSQSRRPLGAQIALRSLLLSLFLHFSAGLSVCLFFCAEPLVKSRLKAPFTATSFLRPVSVSAALFCKDTFVLTAGTDSVVRFWDLKVPNQSYPVSSDPVRLAS